MMAGNDAKEPRRAAYFEDPAMGRGIQDSFTELLAGSLRQVVAKYLPPENTQRLRHGGDWKHPGLPNAISSGMEQHSATLEVSFEEVVKNDLGAIDRVVQAAVHQMERQFLESMYGLVNTACTTTGNVVDARASGSPAEAFADMLEKIEVGVDKDGNVRFPELHGGPEVHARLSESLRAASPALRQRIEEIAKKKGEDALRKERERRLKFARYGEEA